MVCRKNIYGLLLVLMAICFAQCAKKFEYGPAENAIVIDSISPQRGTENTQVRIYGKNFPVDTAKIKTFFNNNQGVVIEKSTNNVILASVPAEAGTGNVDLKIGNQIINGPVFTYDYDAPVILDVQPLTGIVGTEITINGRKFSANVANNKVEVNGVVANITSSTTTQIKAKIPETKNGAVRVTSNGIANQGPIFKFIPQITSIDKISAYVNDVVVLTGKYFDAGTNVVVNFNGVPASVESLTSTTLNVRVPASTTGNIVVAVDGVNSNPQPFTYRIAPTITSLSKTSAFAGDTLTIYGSNFSGVAAPIVMFNTSQATVLNYTNNQIKVNIPNGTSGNVTVSVDGITSNTVPFAYLINIVANSLNQALPVLRNVSGIDGATVVIKGGLYGTTASRIRVTVGTQNAQIVSVDNGNVTFLAPSYASSQANAQQVKVYLDNVEATYPNGTLTFTYLEPTILSTSVSIVPAVGLPAGWYTFTFTINGSNYNATAQNANFEMLIDGVKYTPTVNGNTATISTTQTTSFLKNRYDIQVRNKWGSFVSAFQRNVLINDFDYSFVNNTKRITVNGDGFGNSTDLNRSVRVYRIVNGVKNYLNVNATLSWTDDQVIVSFSDNYVDDLTYGVEVRVNTKLTVKEKFFDYIRIG